MKKILFFILVLISINTFSQNKISSYYNSYFNENYNIELSVEDTNQFELYINACSTDNLISKGGIIINEDQYDNFIEQLNNAKSKYIEWTKTAKSNNVTDIDKDMDFVSFSRGYFKCGSDWHFQYSVNLTYTFRIIKSKGILKHVLLIKTGKLQASDNEFMTADGFILVFSSIKEINNFLTKISMTRLNTYLKKPQKEDLFK